MNDGSAVSAPFKEGEILDLECVGVGKRGDGIFKYNNFVIVVPDAIQGVIICNPYTISCGPGVFVIKGITRYKEPQQGCSGLALPFNYRPHEVKS